MDAMAHRWPLVGGTHLFRLYDTPDAVAAQSHLADHRIWSRIFPWSRRLIRLGLPGMEPEWQRLAMALGQ
jgi:cobalamin biosynthetic protein CobC